MAKKERLDVLLTERGLVSSRSQAKRSIMAGKVLVDGEVVDKAGARIKLTAKIKLKGKEYPYVSRGGLKLEKALRVFEIDTLGKEAIDIGASTGGFTDCLLQNGVKQVYAIDVGYGQLAWELRQDDRVEVIERTNFRYLTPDQLKIKVPLIVTDVSFISLRLIIPPAVQFLQEEGDIVALVKPQFEAGPDRVGKNGVVRDSKVHREVINELSSFFQGEGLALMDLNYSPITGASSKNIEFLMHLKKTREETDPILWQRKIEKIVDTAHSQFERG
ncbi:TlyA family RNA methyltransferase [Halocella sp. SP3-1]|uniref:TlyA family RNA methyltransferase n=1 Tax=Halocella sp. SP3-1 TaxID=2382161 RepID=UPI000F7553A4|nr:TlyA family RNA methyltransferase [Halocella sp. SP3-1]AZO95643.1 TlyA family RNA methyltransferase [Halocella sp. SP3-1]